MWNLPEPRKFDKDVSLLASLPYKWRDSRGRQAVNSRATRATLLRMPLVNAFITGLWRLLMISRSPEASEEEERSEHEAQRDRDRAAVLLHPRPQGAEHRRGPLWHGCIEADEHENGNSENHEHQPERHGATSRAEACPSDQVEARDEDREVLDLEREERHPEPEGPRRRHGAYRFHPPRRLCVGIRCIEQAPEAQDNEQTADHRADDSPDRRGATLRSTEESEPHDTYRGAGSEVAERESSGVG